MSVRSVAHADVVPLLAGAHVDHFELFEFDFASGTVYAAKLDQPITINGHTYQGAGLVGSVSDIVESQSREATGFQCVLSGVPSALLSSALTEDYKMRAARRYVVLYDAANRLFRGPTLEQSGIMDQMIATRDGSNWVITLTVQDKRAFWKKSRARRHNDADQQANNPGDDSKSFVAQMAEYPIAWPTADYFRG